MEYNVRQVNNFLSDYGKDKKLQSDKDITLAVLARMPSLISYTSEPLLHDKDVALTAVSKDGRTLRFFPDEIRSDEDVVLAAVKNFRSSFSFACGKAKQSKKIALAVASVGGDTVALLDPTFLDDEEIAKSAVGRNPKSIRYFSDRVRALPEIASLALKQDRTLATFIPDEAFKNDEVFRVAIRITDDGKVAAGVLTENTPVGIYEKLSEENMRFNYSLQNIDLTALDGERMKYVLELGLGVTGKKAEAFHKFVEADDKTTVAYLIQKKFPTAKTIQTELEYASKHKKLRVLPILLSAAHGAKKPVYESDERKMLMRNLKRNSPLAAKRFIDDIATYAHDEEAVRLAASVDGSILKVLYLTDFAGDKTLVTTCLKGYLVRNCDEPLLKGLKGVELDYQQCLIACRRDGRNYFYLPEQFRGSEELKRVAYDNGAENYRGDGA